MAGDIGKTLGGVAGILGVLCIVVGWPVWHWAGEEGLRAFGAAWGITGVVAALTSVAVIVARHRRPETVAAVFLGCVGVRVVATAAGALGLYRWLRLATWPFVVSLMACYLALLAWESWQAIGAIRAIYGPLDQAKADTGLTGFGTEPSE